MPRTPPKGDLERSVFLLVFDQELTMVQYLRGGPETRSETVIFRCTPSEKKRLQALARNGNGLGETIRQLLAKATPAPDEAGTPRSKSKPKD